MKTKTELIKEIISYLQADPKGEQTLFPQYHRQRLDWPRIRKTQLAALSRPDEWMFGTSPVFGCVNCGAYIIAVEPENQGDSAESSELPACDRCGGVMARQSRYILDGRTFQFSQLVAIDGEPRDATTEHIRYEKAPQRLEEREP